MALTLARPCDEALDALGLRVVALQPDGRVLWRTAAFEAALPGLEYAAAPPPGVTGLAEALADMRLARPSRRS